LANFKPISNPADQSISSEESLTSGKPPWLKVRLPTAAGFFQVAEILKSRGLHTICQSAKCPNSAECWSARTATFLILGDICTRSCGFCAVKKGKPLPPSAEEAERVAEAVDLLGLDYAVFTSVTRDDLKDGGASIFAATVRAVKAKRPQTKVELLIPDFGGDEEALVTVIDAGPDVLNHNLETVASCYPLIHRPPESYHRSLNVLKKAGKLGALTKSGLMVGLGETLTELLETLADLRSVGCSFLTVGQYLRPGREQVAVKKYYPPGEFASIKHAALEMGFTAVEAGPLVRSSYQAARMFASRPKGGTVSSCAT